MRNCDSSERFLRNALVVSVKVAMKLSHAVFEECIADDEAA